MRPALFLFVLLVPTVALAQPAKVLLPDYKYDQVCQEPMPATDHLFLNANTGDQIRGKTQFPEGTTVQVVYLKPNPFRYSYAFSHTFLDVDATQTFDFFKLVPGFGGALQQLTGLATSAAPIVAKATACAPTKSVLKGKASKVDAKVVTAGDEKFKDVLAGDSFTVGTDVPRKIASVDSESQLTLVDAVPNDARGDLTFEITRDATSDVTLRDTFQTRTDALLKSVQTATQGPTKTDNDTVGEIFDGKSPRVGYSKMQLTLFASQALDCKAVLPQVNSLLYDIRQDILPISARVDGYVKKLDDLVAQGEALRADVNAANFVNGACGSEVKSNVAKALDGDTGPKKADENEKAVQTQVTDMLASYDKLREIFTSSNLFYSFDQITQPRSGYETIHIDITPRKDKDPVPKPRDVRIQFGDAESRIRLSAGIAFSSAPDVRIGRVPGKDGDKDVQRFGFESNSTFRPSALVMVSVLPWDVKYKGIRRATWGPSVGLVLSQRGDGTVTEYVGGLSFGIAGDVAFVTVGLHAARPESFPTGYKEGDIIPTGMGDPLPVRRDWTKAFMASLTFKIR